MIRHTFLLFGLPCLLLPLPTEASEVLPICNETVPNYPVNNREKLFEAVVEALQQETSLYYDCALEKLAARIWSDSQAGRRKIEKYNVQEFKYKGKTTEDFVSEAVNSWRSRFEKKKKKTYAGCFYRMKKNGKSKAVCLFI